jgi:hypothetical protein
MQINVIKVATEQRQGKKPGSQYSQLTVTYKSDRGDIKEKKIMSFANPAVYNTLKDAKDGDVFEVATQKDGEYVNWTSAVLYGGDGGMAVVPTKSVSDSRGAEPKAMGTRSTYETPEERALRQRLIVRQSSISNAVEILTTGAKTPPDVDSVFGLAEKIHDWVYIKPDLFQEKNNLDTDIPF